ncbi:caspase-8-like isoform X2 [Acanthaster planci]|uniref:Caspase-8 n=1 Tax=Acanthaster planci TaxID=133434 RepID=A0A8B7ZF56_ACAPL|nr:caspase-8-like isoform X2 [Acanthaster planci]
MTFWEDDSVPAEPMAFLHLLKNLDDGLGSEDCHKLSFIITDLGIPKAKLELVKQATDIFDELEKRALIAADDVHLLWELMDLIHRKDLLKIIDSYCKRHFVKQLHRDHTISKYRLLLLEVADSTSTAELECFKQGCKDLLGRQAVSKIKNVYQLFSLLEERETLSPSRLAFLFQLLSLAGNHKMMHKIQHFENQGSLPDDELVQLSSHLASEWRKLGSFLGLGHHTLQAIDLDQHSTEGKAAEVLFKWRHTLSNKEDAYGILSKALKMCDRLDLAEVVNNMAREHQQSALSPGKVVYQDMGGHGPTPHLMKPSDFCKTSAPSLPIQATRPVSFTHISDHGLPDTVLRELSEYIIGEWKKIGTFLNLEYSIILGIDQNHCSSEDKAYHMLMTWRSRLSEGTDAVTTLAAVLKTVGRVDLSERLKVHMAQPLQSMNVQFTQQPEVIDWPAHYTRDSQQQQSQADATPEACSENVAEQMEGMEICQSHGEQEKPHTPQEQQTYGGITMSKKEHVIGQESLPEYRMTRNPRGLCMIINNINFVGNRFRVRTGSGKDTGKLNNLFNKLHFKVEVKEDLSARDMLDWFKRVSQLDHSQFDCFACCILTHGAMGKVYGTDCNEIEIHQIMALFTAVSCQSLAGKPKMFFIQACQGHVQQVPAKVQDTETDEPPCGIGADIKTLPNEADFLLSYATVPGYVSYRSKSQGSWFVNALVDQITKHHNTSDLMSILTTVNSHLSDADAKFKEEGEIFVRKQVPAPSYTLRKKVFLRSLVE